MKLAFAAVCISSAPVFAQPAGVRVIRPAAPRYPDQTPVVVHIGQTGGDVPARLSRFGLIDVIAPARAGSPALTEALRYAHRLRAETGVIAWSEDAAALGAVAIDGHASWYVSARAESASLPKTPRLAIIIWAPETNSRALLRYETFHSAGVRWIRLNPSAQHLAELAGRNAAILTENAPNARFDRHPPVLVPAPENGGPSDAVGVAACALELADRTHRRDW